MVKVRNRYKGCTKSCTAMVFLHMSKLVLSDPQHLSLMRLNEADNFAFSGGVRSNAGSSWRTLSGNALPYALSSSGGIYYVISGNWL